MHMARHAVTERLAASDIQRFAADLEALSLQTVARRRRLQLVAGQFR